MPKKSYWLAPEQRAETQDFLKTYFAWFGCALYLVIVFAFDYAVLQNLHPDSPPPPSRLWYVLAGFLLFTAVWTARMLVRFTRVPPHALKG